MCASNCPCSVHTKLVLPGGKKRLQRCTRLNIADLFVSNIKGPAVQQHTLWQKTFGSLVVLGREVDVSIA